MEGQRKELKSPGINSHSQEFIRQTLTTPYFLEELPATPHLIVIFNTTTLSFTLYQQLLYWAAKFIICEHLYILQITKTI